MSSNFANQTPYLRTSRDFPENLQALSVEITKSYIDIANCVNNRTISIFNKGRPVINGESWFITSKRQQGIRQVYTFTAAGNIAHGINTSQIAGFVRIYGTVQDNSGNWYPLPVVSTANVNQQISIQVTSTNIVITAGAGAITISQGFVVLEWLTNT